MRRACSRLCSVAPPNRRAGRWTQPPRRRAAPRLAAGRRGASRTPESAKSGAESASWRVPWERSVYHPEAGQGLADTVARQRAEEPDRKIDVQLDVAGTVAAREHAAALVAVRQGGAVRVRNSERQAPDRRQGALEGGEERVEACAGGRRDADAVASGHERCRIGVEPVDLVH